MKALMIAALGFLVFAANAQTHVNGYYRSNGTYVEPHYRSAPNTTATDNWSTKGNTNPYTGQPGYKTCEYPYCK